MKGYDSYKNSKIEGIKEVPSHWKSIKLKFIGNLYSGLTGKSGNDFYNEDNPLSRPYINFKNIANNVKINPNQFDLVEIKPNEEQNQVRKGDLFFLMSSENFDDIAKTAVLVDDLNETYLNSFCRGFRIHDKNFAPEFLNYLLLSGYYREILSNEAKGFTRINIQVGKINNFTIYAPFNKEEQTKIAAFLDYKTNLIEATIEKKKRLIELLKEKRQAVINEAVTIGLNPNAKMKDSGVEWLGEINKDWQIKKIKHTTFVKGRIGWQNLRAEDFIDYGPYYLVTGTDFKNGNINWEGCHRVDEERFNLDPFIILQEDDILITKDGTIGKIAIVKDKPENVTLNSGVFVTRPIKNDYIPDYLFWVFNSVVFTHFIDYNKSGATIQHLYQNVFLEFSYPLPTIEEQKELIIFLNQIDNKFKRTISNVEEIIIKLQTYRQSLISEAVTGKIDVRDWQPSKKA